MSEFILEESDIIMETATSMKSGKQYVSIDDTINWLKRSKNNVRDQIAKDAIETIITAFVSLKNETPLKRKRWWQMFSVTKTNAT